MYAPTVEANAPTTFMVCACLYSGFFLIQNIPLWVKGIFVTFYWTM